ncbi:MAG: hypothetical protein IJ123_09610 [Blautia sp.]|nr:hypothetical protein [Blautia sp.]
MEKRLCYCKSCRSFFIIDPGKRCPKCGNALVSSVVTESEWDRSSVEQRDAFKKSMKSVSDSGGSSAGGNNWSASGGNRAGGNSWSTSGRSGSFGDAFRSFGDRLRSLGSSIRSTFSGNSFQGGSFGNRGYSYGGYAEYEKRMNSYRIWSTVVLVIGIISFFSIIGQYAQAEAQGYVITTRAPMYVGCALSAFCAYAGFYGRGVSKQPNKLDTSWKMYIAAAVGLVVLGIAFQLVPGWLCALGCGINIYNGYKLKKG